MFDHWACRTATVRDDPDGGRSARGISVGHTECPETVGFGMTEVDRWESKPGLDRKSVV